MVVASQPIQQSQLEDEITWVSKSALPWRVGLKDPLSQGENPLPSKHPKVRVGCVVLVQDACGAVLLIRRARHMRTFPHAWVLPGGSQDPGETLSRAGARELYEETGLSVEPGHLEPLCLWESCFPTSIVAVREVGQLQGHHLVVVLLARLASKAETLELSIQKEEADAAVWVPAAELHLFHLMPLDELSEEGYKARAVEEGGVVPMAPGARWCSHQEVGAHEGVADAHVGALLEDEHFHVSEMAQIYPSVDGRLHGTGEAHMWGVACAHKILTSRDTL